MEQSTSNKKRVLTGIVAVAMLALLAGGAFALKGKEQTASAAQPGNSSGQSSQAMAQASEPSATAPASSTYRNGTYTATGDYVSPGGNEHITVTVTLSSDKITAASVAPQPATSTSRQYQGMFASNFKQFVVGKDADEVSLSRVSGSSLTSRGFNDALDQIKQQAKA
jgi:uncharacterized protein with FMN-binding domain